MKLTEAERKVKKEEKFLETFIPDQYGGEVYLLYQCSQVWRLEQDGYRLLITFFDSN